jgi:hypothetical protein
VRRSELLYIVIGVLIAGVVGGLVGEIIGSFLPEGAARVLFLKSVQVGFQPGTLEFYAITVTFGLVFKFNFVSVLMMIFVLAYFRWWYL